MNKNELIEAVADSSGLTRKDTAAAVDAILATVTKTLKSGGDVRLVGFGTFMVAKRKARTGRNPSTGEVLKIPASKTPKFKPGKTLKDAVS